MFSPPVTITVLPLARAKSTGARQSTEPPVVYGVIVMVPYRLLAFVWLERTGNVEEVFRGSGVIIGNLTPSLQSFKAREQKQYANLAFIWCR